MISETKIPISVAPLFIIHSLKLEVCHEWLPLLWQRTDQYAGISFVIIIKAEFNRRRRHYEVRSQRIGLAARFVVCYVPIRSFDHSAVHSSIHIVYPINLLWNAKQSVSLHEPTNIHTRTIYGWDVWKRKIKIFTDQMQTNQKEQQISIFFFVCACKFVCSFKL